MAQDITWKAYFSDNERYADLINGIGCAGEQAVTKDDLQELDTQTGMWCGMGFVRKMQTLAVGRIGNSRKSVGYKTGRHSQIRDLLRRAAFGMNFVIIGIENQETTDYSMPLRSMSYDTGEYEKQAAEIRRETRRSRSRLSAGEYLYGFRKESRLHPVITFVLYAGLEPWDGPETLHDILDFTNIPEGLRKMAPDYRLNLIEIRKLKDTSVFKTDVKQIFDFIRCSEDKVRLKELVEGDEYYQNMDEDAFDVAAHYTNAEELIETKDYYSREDGKLDMCRAIKELIEDGREEGREEGRLEGRVQVMTATAHRMLATGRYTLEEITEISGLSIDEVNKIREIE